VSDVVVVVRCATDGDGAAIGAVHGAAWAAAYADVFEPGFLARAVDGRRAGWSHTLARILASADVMLVAERHGAVVAFAHGGAAHDERPVGEIHAFYADPSAWGTGAASALMDAACTQLATEWDEVILWTLDRAGRARGFYEKVGFVATGRTRDQELTDWTSTTSVTRPVVEYAKRL
jgi:GNAT superfamily N-acetyltransferase